MVQDKQKDKQQPKHKAISLLNYNLYCLPWFATLFKPSTCPLSAERAHHFITNHISSFDIMCLQEVWNPRYRSIERNALQKGLHVVGSSYATLPRILNLMPFGGGLMIISKYPIVESREALFERGKNADGFVSKGVLYAKIDIGSTMVHVFNTHLQASYGCEYQSVDPNANVRKQQIQKVTEFMNSVVNNDNLPIILMGDFNVNARKGKDDDTDSEEYLDMMKALNGDLYSISDITKVLENTHPITHEGSGVFVGDRVSRGGQRLDFILDVRRKSTPRREIKHKFVKSEVVPFLAKDKVFTQVSDHYGVNVIMEVGNETAEYIVEKSGDDFKLSHASIQLSF